MVKLHDELNRLNPKGTTDYVYLSGATIPNLGDFNVYGVLRAVQHLPIYDEMIVSNRSTKGKEEMGMPPPIAQWVQHMSQHIWT